MSHNAIKLLNTIWLIEKEETTYKHLTRKLFVTFLASRIIGEGC